MIHADMKRCVPSKPCPRRETCARANVVVGETMPRPVKDYSLLFDSMGLCGEYIKLDRKQ